MPELMLYTLRLSAYLQAFDTAAMSEDVESAYPVMFYAWPSQSCFFITGRNYPESLRPADAEYLVCLANVVKVAVG